MLAHVAAGVPGARPRRPLQRAELAAIDGDDDLDASRLGRGERHGDGDLPEHRRAFDRLADGQGRSGSSWPGLAWPACWARLAWRLGRRRERREQQRDGRHRDHVPNALRSSAPRRDGPERSPVVQQPEMTLQRPAIDLPTVLGERVEVVGVTRAARLRARRWPKASDRRRASRAAPGRPARWPASIADRQGGTISAAASGRRNAPMATPASIRPSSCPTRLAATAQPSRASGTRPPAVPSRTSSVIDRRRRVRPGLPRPASRPGLPKRRRPSLLDDRPGRRGAADPAQSRPAPRDGGDERPLRRR